MSSNEIKTYISAFPDSVQQRLKSIYKLVIQIVPDAVESISYGLPAFKLKKKPLIYFGAFEKHIGLYATPTGHEAFKEKLAAYKQGKGSVQFPHNQDLPLTLIHDIIQFRKDEILKK